MDIRLEVTKKVIDALEAGSFKFRQMLLESANNGMPFNGKSGLDYRGSNVLMLWIRQKSSGYKSNCWLTFKQALELGGCVRKDEKSTLCSYFELKEKKAESEEEEKSNYMLIKPFWLFNVEQIEGLPEKFYLKGETRENLPMEDIEKYLLNTGARVTDEHKTRIYYDRSNDLVNVPNIKNFVNSENYYLALAHEITHWTGAEHRLNRVKGKKFGDDVYAFEELIAELGACMVGGKFGLLDGNLEGHVDYLDSWLKCLKADKNAIFSASKMAFEAYEYIESFNKSEERKAA